MPDNIVPPIQPIVTDSQGVRRFAKNRIVEDLLDVPSNARGLNTISIDFQNGKYYQWEVDQFWQLIGYSVEGYLDCQNTVSQAMRDRVEALGDPHWDDVQTVIHAQRRIQEIEAEAKKYRKQAQGWREAAVEKEYGINPEEIRGMVGKFPHLEDLAAYLPASPWSNNTFFDFVRKNGGEL